MNIERENDVAEDNKDERRMDISIPVSKVQAITKGIVFLAVLAGSIGYPLINQIAPVRYEAYTRTQAEKDRQPVVDKVKALEALQTQIWRDQVKIIERLKTLDKLEELHDSVHGDKE